jgi:hypothetical protein
MSPAQLQLVRRLHHEVGHLPRARLEPIAAGDLITLLNIIHAEERRADSAEQRLRKLMLRAAEEKLDELFGDLGDVPGEWAPQDSSQRGGQPSPPTVERRATAPQWPPRRSGAHRYSG